MNLQIRDPRARALAKELAEKKKVSMTEAVVGALEAELQRQKDERPLKERLQATVDDLWARRRPGGRDLTKDEIDAMWGHED